MIEWVLFTSLGAGGTAPTGRVLLPGRQQGRAVHDTSTVVCASVYQIGSPTLSYEECRVCPDSSKHIASDSATRFPSAAWLRAAALVSVCVLVPLTDLGCTVHQRALYLEKEVPHRFCMQINVGGGGWFKIFSQAEGLLPNLRRPPAPQPEISARRGGPFSPAMGRVEREQARPSMTNRALNRLKITEASVRKAAREELRLGPPSAHAKNLAVAGPRRSKVSHTTGEKDKVGVSSGWLSEYLRFFLTSRPAAATWLAGASTTHQRRVSPSGRATDSSIRFAAVEAAFTARTSSRRPSSPGSGVAMATSTDTSRHWADLRRARTNRWTSAVLRTV